MRSKRNIPKKAITRKIGRPSKPVVPRWFPYATAFTLAFLLILTINFRAISDNSRESAENERLNQQIQEAMIENVSLQEEIHYLKNDSSTIEKEVKKFGLVKPKELNSEPVK
jgi:septal ring factor EnvC (AmiA/AmiB activator)